MKLLAALLALAATPVFAQDEASLRAADAAQLQAALKRDADAIATMTSPSFIINNPLGETGTGERMIARFRSGEIAHESFTREIERISIAGDVGIVMGREIVEPAQSSLEGKGVKRGPVLRRFTNVWQWQNGAWRWIGRHANEVREIK